MRIPVLAAGAIHPPTVPINAHKAGDMWWARNADGTLYVWSPRACGADPTATTDADLAALPPEAGVQTNITVFAHLCLR